MGMNLATAADIFVCVGRVYVITLPISAIVFERLRFVDPSHPRCRLGLHVPVRGIGAGDPCSS